MQRKLYQQIASSFRAIENCRKARNAEWQSRHEDTIEALVKEHMPSGSGFDNGTAFDFGESRINKLVFTTEFHHMSEHGYYSGWTEHKVIVTPDLASGFNMRITGRDRNDIKDMIGETFQCVLNSDIENGVSQAA